MFFSKIKIIKNEKIDNDSYIQEDIIFKYNKRLYSYISLKYKNGPYLDSYQMEIKSIPDYEFIYFEYNDENNKIIKEKNYKYFDELFFKELQKCKLINKKYNFTEIGIINKLEYYEEKFKNKKNVDIFLYASGIKKYNRIHDNRKRFLVKINGQFYKLIGDKFNYPFDVNIGNCIFDFKEKDINLSINKCTNGFETNYYKIKTDKDNTEIIKEDNPPKLIYSYNKKNIVGTEIEIKKYDPEYFDEELFNVLQSREDIKEFLGFDYRDYNDFKSKAEIMNKTKELNENELGI